jgi:hypothetical protein
MSKKMSGNTKAKRKKRSPSDYSQVVNESKRTNNPLTAFSMMPRGLSVEIQDKNEKILLLVRRHVITNLKWVMIAVLLIVSPLVFPIMPFFDKIPGNFQFMGIILWYLLTLALSLEGFLNWYFDMFIVTDERIIDIDFKNLIYRNVTSTKIDRIEDVTYTVSGAISSFLDFGNVMIQTAGAGMGMDPQETSPHMEIYDTPHPAKVAKLINELILEEEQEKIEGRVR